MPIEQEIRTKNLKLLMCRMKYSEENKLFFELKNGKRVENMSLEEFVEIVNSFAGMHTSQLHIVTK